MFRKYRTSNFNLISALCLISIVFLAAYSLESTHWTENLNLVTALAVIGVLLGVLLGITGFNRKQLSIMLTLYSLIALFSFIVNGTSQGALWNENWGVFQTRILNAFTNLLQGSPVEDNILFIAGMGVLYWVVTVWAGVALTRKGEIWLPAVFLSAAVISTQFFQPPVYRNELLSGVFFFLLIFLLGYQQYQRAHNRWKNENAYEDQDARKVFLSTAAIISIVIVMIAWSIPAIVDLATPGTKQHKAFVQSLEDTGDLFSNLFSSLTSQPVSKESNFGDTFSLGLSQPLNEEVIFTAISPESDLIEGNYYWEARNYSTYSEGTWSSFEVEERTLENNVPAQSESDMVDIPAPFIVVANTDLSYFYTSGRVISIDRPSRAVEMYPDSADQEVIAWKPLLPLGEKDSYQFNTYLPTLTFEDLLNAGNNYPTRIKRTYLQLPEDFSLRITNLSEAITAGIDSDFEKVLAITSNLRNTYRYSLEINEIPATLDPVFWFLFEGKRGFCNFYASAEVLMLRSIGIPARLGVGYAQGVEVERGKVFEIRGKDSHAWAEVYFPEIGWVIFEPTTAQPQVTFRHEYDVMTENVDSTAGNIDEGIDRSAQNGAGSGDFSRYDAIEQRLSAQEDFLYDFSVGGSSTQWYLILLPWVISIAVISFILFGRIRYHGEQIPIQRYSIIQMEKRRKNVPRWLGDWSAYREQSFLRKNIFQIDWGLRFFIRHDERQMTIMEKTDLLKQFIPSASQEIQFVLNAFQEEVYGGRESDQMEAKVCLRKIRQAVFAAWVTGGFNHSKKKAKTA